MDYVLYHNAESYPKVIVSTVGVLSAEASVPFKSPRFPDVGLSICDFFLIYSLPGAAQLQLIVEIQAICDYYAILLFLTMFG